MSDMTAYCVVAVESAGRQMPIAFLERVKEEFTKKYGGGKAANAAEKSLNKEFAYVYLYRLTYYSSNKCCYSVSFIYMLSTPLLLLQAQIKSANAVLCGSS